jgi:hypothetical protein
MRRREDRRRVCSAGMITSTAGRLDRDFESAVIMRIHSKILPDVIGQLRFFGNHVSARCH